MKHLVLTLTATALAATTPAIAAQPAAAQAAARSAGTYARMAGSADTYEKQSSQLVLGAAKSPEVRRFAEMMVADHANTTAQLIAAARQSGVTVDPKLLSKHAQMLQQLRRTSAKAREKTYLRQQVMAHEEALALHQAYAARGDDPAMRQAASAAVPVVQGHLDEARRLLAATR